jgi:hypothetical protein
MNEEMGECFVVLSYRFEQTPGTKAVSASSRQRSIPFNQACNSSMPLSESNPATGQFVAWPKASGVYQVPECGSVGPRRVVLQETFFVNLQLVSPLCFIPYSHFLFPFTPLFLFSSFFISYVL